jgi:hypothetical protein
MPIVLPEGVEEFGGENTKSTQTGEDDRYHGPLKIHDNNSCQISAYQQKHSHESDVSAFKRSTFSILYDLVATLDQDGIQSPLRLPWNGCLPPDQDLSMTRR